MSTKIMRICKVQEGDMVLWGQDRSHIGILLSQPSSTPWENYYNVVIFWFDIQKLVKDFGFYEDEIDCFHRPELNTG